MANQTRGPLEHNVEIRYDENSGEVTCFPGLLQPPERVIPDDMVTWTCDKPWAVVFGPDSPFKDQVMGEGLTVLQEENGAMAVRSASSTTKVVGRRPGDFRKHKYVAVVWTGNKLVACDPEVDVDED